MIFDWWVFINDFLFVNIVSVNSNLNFLGIGGVDCEEILEMIVVVVVIQVFLNGNLVIEGCQEIRVNFEVCELIVVGIVWLEDIIVNNIIVSQQIVEVCIGYGGCGQIMDVQQLWYGNQVLDIILLF